MDPTVLHTCCLQQPIGAALLVSSSHGTCEHCAAAFGQGQGNRSEHSLAKCCAVVALCQFEDTGLAPCAPIPAPASILRAKARSGAHGWPVLCHCCTSFGLLLLPVLRVLPCVQVSARSGSHCSYCCQMLWTDQAGQQLQASRGERLGVLARNPSWRSHSRP